MTLGVTAAAAALAVAAGWLHAPRAPKLDGERWFKLALCTLLRGRLEAGQGTVEQWEASVTRLVPYHPAGRWPERKVSNPGVAPAERLLDGEKALLEALARRETPRERLAWLYDEDPIGIDVRLSDPAELGEAYTFRGLGPGATWDTLAAWGAGDQAFRDAVLRALPVRWVWFEGRPERKVGPPVLDALAAELDVVRIPWGSTDVEARLAELVAPDLALRLVLVGEEAGATELLRRLATDAGLRDRVAGVLAIGGVIGGRLDEDGAYGEAARKDWLEAWFRQAELDVDVVRLVPYAAVQWLAADVWPPGTPGLPLQASRFPEPSAQGAPVISVEVVDLGPLWADRELPAELVAKALVATLAGYIAARR